VAPGLHNPIGWLKDEPPQDKEVRMKQVVVPALALALTFTGWSLHACGWLHPTGHQPAAGQQADDPYSSDAAYRHRACQPRHWRGMMLRQ
jgi:hypothetical protein